MKWIWCRILCARLPNRSLNKFSSTTDPEKNKISFTLTFVGIPVELLEWEDTCEEESEPFLLYRVINRIKTVSTLQMSKTLT